MRIFNCNVMLDTFFKKGVRDTKDDWGVSMITGPQGSGKNYLATLLLKYQYKDFKIKTNVKSLHINDKMEFFTKIDEIIDDIEQKVVYVIDEISKKYDKSAKTDQQFYAWLQQSRKRHRIVILITQELKEVPMWLRRPIRFTYTTRKVPLLPLFYTTKGDGINLTLNTETMEWECPKICSFLYKRNKTITDLYDTYEPISDL